MPTIFIYSPILNAPVTARTRLAPTRRYARYAETVTYSVPVRDSAAHCVRCGMMVARAEAKGEYGRQEARWDYVARCAPPIFPSPAVATHTSFRHTPSHPRPRPTTTVWRNLEQDPRRGETFTFSAKERDSETGFSYFGSRYYSSDLSIWLSVDPMSDKYPSLSPYVYCANNPVKLVDPNGGEIGDYFNQYGKYLGTDCDDDGKIHIIQDNDWNNLKERISWEGIDGKRVISQDLGEILSEKPSSLDLTDDAIQKIVGHYNNTGLKLNRGNEGALNTEFEENGTSYTKKLTINISKWRNHSFLDNYYDIKSSFDHEKGHIKQCKGIGIVKFKKLSPYQQEEYAVDYQKSQPAFSRTSDKYKKWIDTYLQGKKK